MSDTIVYALEMLGQGMLSIFTVLGLIALVVALLGKIEKKNK